MPYQVGMREALLDWGVQVLEVPGWQTRGTPNGGSSLNPVAFTAHHDVIGPWSYPPSILVNGRPGLPGPLCQVALDRLGRWWMVAAGHANHAGPGGWRGVSGNSRTIGCEANNLGNGSQEWPTAQVTSYLRGTAALCDYMGVGASMACYHREWSTMGKIDPWGPWAAGSPAPRHWTMSGDHYRAKVAALLRAGNAPAPAPPTQDQQEDTATMYQFIAKYQVNGRDAWLWFGIGPDTGFHQPLTGGEAGHLSRKTSTVFGLRAGGGIPIVEVPQWRIKDYLALAPRNRAS